MTEMDTLLTGLQRTNKTNPNKMDAYDALIGLYGEVKNNVELPVWNELAVLFNYFTPKAKTTAKKDSFAWLWQAVSDDKQREVLHNIYCDGENIVATDGRRLHVMPNKQGLEVGYYNQRKEKLDLDYNYPNYKQVIPYGNSTEVKFQLKEVEINKIDRDGRGRQVGMMKMPGDGWLPVPYLTEALAPDIGATMRYEDGLSPYMFTLTDGRLIVIMPLRG